MSDATDRDLSDALTVGERDILSRWDRGDLPADIAAATGRRLKYVGEVISLYDDRPEPGWRDRLMRSNAAHVAALQRLRMSSSAFKPISVADIEAMLKDRAESLVEELLPNAVKIGDEMVVGSIAGEPGDSLSINVGGGGKHGWWRDFSGTEKGDMLWLIAHVYFRGDIKQAVPWAKSWLRLDDQDPNRLEQHRAEVKARAEQRKAEADQQKINGMERARKRWLQGKVLAQGDPVDRYLLRRRIDLGALAAALGRDRPGALRYHPALQYGWQGPVVPAMVAGVWNLAGAHVATHRTWLDIDRATKAGPELIGWDKRGAANDPKKVMGSPLGGHIPLWKGISQAPLREIAAGTDVYVSEGIEDGLTAACADPSLYVICMIALGYLAALELPPQLGRLIILKQNDPPGSDAEALLQRGARQLRERGVRVAFVTPPAGCKDLNELAARERTEPEGGDR